MLLANGFFQTSFAKTAHGLVRGPSRYRIAGVVDHTCAGEDAGDMLDGRQRGIPVVLPLVGDLSKLETVIENHVGSGEGR